MHCTAEAWDGGRNRLDSSGRARTPVAWGRGERVSICGSRRSVKMRDYPPAGRRTVEPIHTSTCKCPGRGLRALQCLTVMIMSQRPRSVTASPTRADSHCALTGEPLRQRVFESHGPAKLPHRYLALVRRMGRGHGRGYSPTWMQRAGLQHGDCPLAACCSHGKQFRRDGPLGLGTSRTAAGVLGAGEVWASSVGHQVGSTG
ncbi:hypothetical protein OH76DRAFT_360651 [Lentinus brumalis]|uniref:Uncharacterized protein n=1 Tax=Lentinus brumalis TaxID=2498619 RepID=A0A371CJ71_9APHY|nr:hypothetical protein OH76DRAFT_360651 [Polyporus brumalis]